MRKAPRLSAVNGREKRQDSLDAGNTSPTSSQESAPSSVAPASSPATSRSHSRIGSEAGREIVTTTPRQPSRTNYDIPKSVDATGEVKDSSRMTIAIDYGTTFTGIGFAMWPLEKEHPDIGDIVRLVRNWGPEMDNEVKVPSVISYSPRTAKKELQFGANLSPDAVTMLSTKLELDVQDTRLEELDLIIQVLDGMRDLNFQHIKNSKSMPEYTWKTPEDIVTDYLKKVFQPFWEATDYWNTHRAKAQVDIVITIPVKWSYRARNSTLKAIRNAGFNETNFPRLSRYVMVTEPEAAAIYTTRYMQEDGSVNLKENQCFVLCDAGGGTVDVAGYRVKQLKPSLELEEMTISTGAKCGSNFVNGEFKTWLSEILGADYNMLDPRSDDERVNMHACEGAVMRDLMARFEEKKKKFHGESDEVHLDLPASLRHLAIPDKLEEGDLTVTNEEMRSFFDPYVDRIIELILDQIAQIEEKNRSVAAILLIGGFSESKYLQEELQLSLEELRDIRLYRPETSWSAVVQGAVLYGLELDTRQDTQIVIPCPRNYGVKISTSFTKGTHDSRDVVTHGLTNKVLASDQLSWLVRRGDLLLESEEREIVQSLVGSFGDGHSRVFKLPIYEYLGDKAPDRYKISQEDIDEVAELTANFAGYPLERFERKINPKNHTTYYEAKLTLKLRIKGMHMTGEVWWYGLRMDSVEIKDIDKVPAQ